MNFRSIRKTLVKEMIFIRFISHIPFATHHDLERAVIMPFFHLSSLSHLHMTKSPKVIFISSPPVATLSLDLLPAYTRLDPPVKQTT